MAQLLPCWILAGAISLLGVVLPRSSTPSQAYMASANHTWHISKLSKTSDGPENTSAMATSEESFWVFDVVPDICASAVLQFPPARNLPSLLREYYLRPPPAL